MLGKYEHWRYAVDEEAIGWLNLNYADNKRLNLLSKASLEELGSLVSEIERQIGGNRLRGLVLSSAKEGGFAAGADVTEFERIENVAQVGDYLKQVGDVFNRLEALPLPRVAAIHGFCLGGGLELALTADRLIATVDARLGFPEIRLGLFPGLGGTVRSTRKIGGVAAMRLMLSGKTISAAAAKRLGLLERVVATRHHLRWAARKAVLSRKSAKSPSLLKRLSNITPIRPLLARQMLKVVRTKARREHYPAPYALLELWSKYGGNTATMAGREGAAFAPLLVGDSSRGLRRAFFLSEELRKQGGKSDFKPRRVHVVGAGVMGGDIAAWCVYRGMTATLQDNDARALEKAMDRAATFFRRRYRSAAEVRAASRRLLPTDEGVNRADVVIEAIVENAAAKQALLKQLEPQLKPGAVLATNTSSLQLEELAESLAEPQRLIGLHFFNPVAQLPLVEVVKDKNTAAEQVAAGCAFVKAIGKFPLVVKSSPGFLVNRILAPYMFTALGMLDDGLRKEAIDEAALAFGMPMGPVELCDQVGLDVCLEVGRTLGLNKGNGKKSGGLEKLVQEGRLGRKSGSGFYRWKKGRKVAAAPGRVDEKLGDKLIAPMIETARLCLQQKIVDGKDLVDAGMIFGAGFAPFRGGILHYAEGKK